jgi:hypothetical protein
VAVTIFGVLVVTFMMIMYAARSSVAWWGGGERQPAGRCKPSLVGHGHRPFVERPERLASTIAAHRSPGTGIAAQRPV